MGIGAVVEVPARFLHPSKDVQRKIPNAWQRKRVEGIVIRLEHREIKKKVQDAIVIQCDELMDDDEHLEVYAVARHFKVLIEGPEDLPETLPLPAEAAEEEAFDQEMQEIIRKRNENLTVDDDEVLGRIDPTQIDDDNAPLPENVPLVLPNARYENCSYNQQWGHSNVCNRKKQSLDNVNPSLPSQSRHYKPTRIQLWEMLFPKQFIIDVILKLVNKTIKSGEVPPFLGCLFHDEHHCWSGTSRFFLNRTRHNDVMVHHSKSITSCQGIDLRKYCMPLITMIMILHRILTSSGLFVH